MKKLLKRLWRAFDYAMDRLTSLDDVDFQREKRKKSGGES